MIITLTLRSSLNIATLILQLVNGSNLQFPPIITLTPRSSLNIAMLILQLVNRRPLARSIVMARYFPSATSISTCPTTTPPSCTRPGFSAIHGVHPSAQRSGP